MRTILSATILTLFAVSLPSAALAAHVQKTKTQMVTLRLTSAFKGKPAFRSVTAHAELTATQHDVLVKLTTDNLPSPSSIGKRAYVLFATDGHMTSRVGALKRSGNMASLKGQVMMSRIQDLYVYAESSTSAKHPHGSPVLSAMVG